MSMIDYAPYSMGRDSHGANQLRVGEELQRLTPPGLDPGLAPQPANRVM
jgi:hypothetical protein